MKKIHVSAINRKVRGDEKLFVEECDRKYNEKLVAIADSIEISDKAENAKRNTRRMGKMEREAAIERLTREMKEAAKLLEFEHAAFLRDQIDRLRRGENPTVDSAAETERKQNHAQTQRKGRKYLGKR